MDEFTNTLIGWFLEYYTHTWSSIWIIVVSTIIISLILWYKFFPKSAFFVFFELFFEKVYSFFEEILGKDEKSWIKKYVTYTFFLILFSNLLWIILDGLLPIFYYNWLQHEYEHFISIPSADINFNISMAIIALLIILIEQFKFLWTIKFTLEYFPIFGKNFIPYERWKLPSFIDWPLFIIVKLIDIFISLFLWILDIIGHLAKIISLSFRLFGNMTSWSILLMMLVTALWWFIAFWNNFNFPVIWPVIVYLQWILVSFIQALVFPLLVAIFIKVAKTHA